MSDEGNDELRAIALGDAPFTWAAWAHHVEITPCLSAAGKAAVLDAVSVISEYLRADWLDRFKERGVPLLSSHWWLNGAPHVFARILELGLRISLLSRVPGLGDVRKMMANDLGSFNHALLQLEVAGLALRDGWDVILEPSTDTGKADVLIERRTSAMLIEAKVFGLDQRTRAEMEASNALSDGLRNMGWEKNVTFTGTVDHVQDTSVAAWLSSAAAAADRALQQGTKVGFAGPSGELSVYPVDFLAGSSLNIGIRHGDEWSRMLAELDKKALQGFTADVPLWLRFDETPFFWGLHIPSDPIARVRCLTAMAAQLHAAARAHKHLAGLTLSTPPVAGSALTHEWWTYAERSIYLCQAVNPPFFRQALCVPSTHRVGPEFLSKWRDWYRYESTWLEWALAECGYPPLTRLLTGEGADAYLAARSRASAETSSSIA